MPYGSSIPDPFVNKKFPLITYISATYKQGLPLLG